MSRQAKPVSITLLMLVAMARALMGCGGQTAPSTPVVPLELFRGRLVDLSHAYDADTLYWPTSPSRFVLERLSFGATDGGYFYAANAFCSPEHGGTHLDAPIHFSENGWTTEKIPVQNLVAPGLVLDVAESAGVNPDYALTVADVEAWEAQHGQIVPGSIVLLRTGWSRFWPDPKTYLGDDTPGDASRLHFPSYGVEAARFLVDERQVGALGVDTASIDVGASRDFMVHRIAHRANVFGLENLTGLESVPPTGFWVIALPMKIAQGSGGPVRVVAVLSD